VSTQADQGDPAKKAAHEIADLMIAKFDAPYAFTYILPIVEMAIAEATAKLTEQLTQAQRERDETKAAAEAWVKQTRPATERELAARLVEVERERDEAVRERKACHECWDHFTKTVCEVIPGMLRSPLFQQAETITETIKKLRAENERLKGEVEQAQHSADTAAMQRDWINKHNAVYSAVLHTLEEDRRLDVGTLQAFKAAVDGSKYPNEKTKVVPPHRFDVERTVEDILRRNA
jgi:hypothetical protein